MSTPQGPWPGRFVWHDLMTTDAPRAQAFYSALFGWQVTDVPMQGFTYRMIHCGPGPIGGIVQEAAIPVSHWMPYLAVDDVDAAAERVQQLGGSVCVPPTDIPLTGRFSVVADPAGAYLSLYRGNEGAAGANPDDAIPGRVCWNETYSTAPAASQAFYSALVGWRPEVKDMGPAGAYHVQMLGDKQAGGLMQHPLPGLPSCWVVYFFVEDLEASTAKAKGLGAAAMLECLPIPEVGRFSMLTDPTGAAFALFQPAPNLGTC